MLDVDRYIMVNSLPQKAIDLLLALVDVIENTPLDDSIDHVLSTWGQISDTVNQEQGARIEAGRIRFYHCNQCENVNMSVECQLFEEVQTRGWRVGVTHGANNR